MLTGSERAVWYCLEGSAFAAIEITQLLCPERIYDKLAFLPALINFIILIYIYAVKRQPMPAGRDRLLLCGVALTAMADLFLCFIYSCGVGQWPMTVGFAIFSVCEILFGLWLGGGARWLIIRLATLAAMETALVLFNMATVPNCIAMVNLSQLAVNTAQAWATGLKNKNRAGRLFTAGITLFFGCDYSILLLNFLTYGTPAYYAVMELVMVFYVPCLVLLAHSAME